MLTDLELPDHSAQCRRPILRWHGGKWKLANWIIAHLPSHRVYVEPFGGAASVLLRKPSSYAEIYNDLDGELVNLFRVARDQGEDYRHELTDADHADLAGLLCSLRGAVVLSGYRSPLYDDLYRGWRRIERQSYADGARTRTECLWLSPRCPPAGLFD